MTKDEFTEVMNTMCEFYQKQLNPTQVRVWHEVFHEFTKANFSQACRQCMEREESPFFPPIVYVRKYLEQPFDV